MRRTESSDATAFRRRSIYDSSECIQTTQSSNYGLRLPATMAQERVKACDALHTWLVRHECYARLDLERYSDITRGIENGCYIATLRTCKDQDIKCNFDVQQFVEMYDTNVYRVFRNVSRFEAEPLVRAVIEGRVQGNKLATMEENEMIPEGTQKIRDEIERRRNEKYEKKVSRAYFCKKCGDNRTRRLEVQLRSTDEACNYLIKCITCKNTWKT
jgi:DNA-directed RNA polymerase subunit M/transcription elongation factor TFIIS